MLTNDCSTLKVRNRCRYWSQNMKKIGLISDTHGYLDPAVFKHFAGCDEIWHAGDIGTFEVIDALSDFKPVRAVYGNIDGTEFRKVYPEVQRFELESVDVLMTHIGGKPGNYSNPVRAEFHKSAPRLFICGHSHICLVQMDKKSGCLYMNPGAAGKHGFHKVKTLLRFVLDNGIIKDLQVIEIGPRA